jgi:hypothetical protein
MNVTTVLSGMLNKAVAWFRAGYSPDAPQFGHVALVALVSSGRCAHRPV